MNKQEQKALVAQSYLNIKKKVQFDIITAIRSLNRAMSVLGFDDDIMKILNDARDKLDEVEKILRDKIKENKE